MLLVSGCAAVVPLEQAGSLSSYQRLEDSNRFLTRAQVSVSKDEVLEAKTVRIIPTSFSATEAEARLSQAQKKLIATVVDRSLCIGLSDPLPGRRRGAARGSDRACLHYEDRADR